MAFYLLCIAIIAALWWAALWLVLPIEWLQGALPSFIAVHVVPPFLPVVVWWTGKRVWAWRKEKAKERAEKKEAAEKEAAQEAAKAAHREALERRRAHVEFRAIWAEFGNTPKWADKEKEPCLFRDLPPEVLQGTGLEAALTFSLQLVFSAAFAKAKAAVWLPVRLASNHPELLEITAQAWHRAVAENKIEHSPEQPDYSLLPGEGAIQDRVIALFENDPNLPAVILVGMDSPLADSKPSQVFNTKPDHAVAALLLSRPGLIAPNEAQITASQRREANDPMETYWEREQAYSVGTSPQWGKVPIPLQPIFLQNFPPIAVLHRASAVRNPATKPSALTQQITKATQEALISAGLRELPFEEQKTEQAKPKESEFLDLGWIVHTANREYLGPLISALRDVGCELDPIAEASNVLMEHGDVGEARSMLMLAESLIRAAQLQKPVLVAEFNEDISIGIALPPDPKKPPVAEMPTSQFQKAA